MELKFELETQGYIVFKLTKKKILKIGHSAFYGDKFQELLTNLLFLFEIKKTNKIEYLPFNFNLIWQDDFINYGWDFTMKSFDSTISLKIIELSPSNPAHMEILIIEEINFEDLFKNIYFSLKKIFSDFGFIGYKKNWEAGNFPIYEYMILKSEYEESETSKLQMPDDDWRQKYSLSEEIKIIVEGNNLTL